LGPIPNVTKNKNKKIKEHGNFKVFLQSASYFRISEVPYWERKGVVSWV
jgi:hypothetical protein